jgi:hypothetical protein
VSSAPTKSRPTLADDQSGELAFDAIVPRQLAHKRAIGEVFLTGSKQVDRDRFECVGQLPRSHAFFNDGPPGWHDPLLVLEAARQAGLLISHRYLDIPLGYQFLVTKIYVTVEDHDACRRRSEPAETVFDVSVPKRHHRDDVLTGIDIDQRISIDGASSHTAGGAFMFLTPDQYELLREQVRGARNLEGDPATSAPRAADPSEVGRADPRNVVVSSPAPAETDDGFTGDVVVDPSHPSLFDHPLDHVPGTVLLEAYRQAATASAALAHGLTPSDLCVARCRARFGAFAEHELHIRWDCRVDQWDGSSVEVELTHSQPDMEISQASVELVAPEG